MGNATASHAMTESARVEPASILAARLTSPADFSIIIGCSHAPQFQEILGPRRIFLRMILDFLILNWAGNGPAGGSASRTSVSNPA
jgi:hypothetical protein